MSLACHTNSARSSSVTVAVVAVVYVCTDILPWLAWVFVVLGDSYDLDTHTWDPNVRVIRQQDFWYCFGMTVL